MVLSKMPGRRQASKSKDVVAMYVGGCLWSTASVTQLGESYVPTYLLGCLPTGRPASSADDEDDDIFREALRDGHLLQSCPRYVFLCPAILGDVTRSVNWLAVTDL